MSPEFTFLVGGAVTAAATLAVVIYLQPHLRRVLVDVCGTEGRAEFWTAFSNVALVLVPVLGALFYHPDRHQPEPLLFSVSSQVRGALIGLVGAVLVLGWTIARFLPRTPPKESPVTPTDLRIPTEMR